MTSGVNYSYSLHQSTTRPGIDNAMEMLPPSFPASRNHCIVLGTTVLSGIVSYRLFCGTVTGLAGSSYMDLPASIPVKNKN